MPTGSSVLGIRLRAMASTQSMNSPPDNAAIGSSFRWAVMAMARETCGMMSPHKSDSAANRYKCTGQHREHQQVNQPTPEGVDADGGSCFLAQHQAIQRLRLRPEKTAAASTISVIRPMFFHPARVREPIVQNLMDIIPSESPATAMIKLENAVSSALTIMPERISLTEVVLPSAEERANTRKQAPPAPTKAQKPEITPWPKKE